MRVVFIEWNGEITASYVEDTVSVGLANLAWQSNARRGEVIAEMSGRTDQLTSQQKEFYEEIFELGRLFERKRIQQLDDSTHDSIDD